MYRNPSSPASQPPPSTPPPVLISTSSPRPSIPTGIPRALHGHCMGRAQPSPLPPAPHFHCPGATPFSRSAGRVFPARCGHSLTWRGFPPVCLPSVLRKAPFTCRYDALFIGHISPSRAIRAYNALRAHPVASVALGFAALYVVLFCSLALTGRSGAVVAPFSGRCAGRAAVACLLQARCGPVFPVNRGRYSAVALPSHRFPFFWHIRPESPVAPCRSGICLS